MGGRIDPRKAAWSNIKSTGMRELTTNRRRFPATSLSTSVELGLFSGDTSLGNVDEVSFTVAACLLNPSLHFNFWARELMALKIFSASFKWAYTRNITNDFKSDVISRSKKQYAYSKQSHIAPAMQKYENNSQVVHNYVTTASSQFFTFHETFGYKSKKDHFQEAPSEIMSPCIDNPNEISSILRNSLQLWIKVKRQIIHSCFHCSLEN